MSAKGKERVNEKVESEASYVLYTVIIALENSSSLPWCLLPIFDQIEPISLLV